MFGVCLQLELLWAFVQCYCSDYHGDYGQRRKGERDTVESITIAYRSDLGSVIGTPERERTTALWMVFTELHIGR